MNKRNVLSSITVIFAMIFLTACGSALGTTNNLGSHTAPALPETTQVAPAQPALPSGGVPGDLLSAYQGTLENIYAAVSPSVVNIRVIEQASSSSSGSGQIPGFPFFNLPQGQQPQQQLQEALGSGFIWDQQGHIVTNNHVISGASKIEVTFSDGTTVPATLVGADPDSDLAVIKVDVQAGQLHPVALGDSKSIKVGQLAITIGNPFGLEGTMTTGIISAVGRSLPANETAAQSYTIPDIIQTDAPINPGNSGGVLIDAQGQVLGVTSAIESPVSANAGIGFAIPSSIVQSVVPALIKDGKYVHSWLGVSGTTLTPDLAKAMNLDLGQRGALVEEILPNSPAEKAGLRGSTQQTTINGQTTNVGGDVITAIDSQPVLQMDDLIAYLAGIPVGQTVSLAVVRDGKPQTLNVTVAARPASQAQNNAPVQPTAAGIRLGILGVTVDSSIAKEMNLPNGQQGVLIEQVQPGSLAEAAGLQAGTKSVTINGQDVLVGGDIITAINGQAVTSIGDLRTALGQLPTDHTLTLTILRNGQETQVTVQ
jgi:2-alkenal reductase